MLQSVRGRFHLRYIETYADRRVPHRKVFTNIESAQIDINNYIQLCNVSISPWWFTELEQKYAGVGDGRHKVRMGPKYSTALTDCLFLDIDCLREDGSFRENAYKSKDILWNWAEKNDYKRDVSFTGGGYQMKIAANVQPQYYKDTVKDLVKRLNIEIDDESISLVDMRRYIGSWNFGKSNKSPRRCFCISLKDHEVRKSWGYHIKLAQQQRKEVYVYGSSIYKPPRVVVKYQKKEFDRNTSFTLDLSVDDILGDYGYSYDDICKSMRDLIEKKHVEHFERIRVIKYLKTIIGMSYGDVVMLLPKLLVSPHGNGETDGSHSISEGQVDSVFYRDMSFNPTGMKIDGYCDPGCNKCQEYLKMIRGIL